jgi:protein TonB
VQLTALGWIAQAESARAIARNTHNALALAVSVGLHSALFIAGDALLLATRTANLTPTVESHVVHVRIEPAAKGGSVAGYHAKEPRLAATNRPPAQLAQRSPAPAPPAAPTPVELAIPAVASESPAPTAVAASSPVPAATLPPARASEAHRASTAAIPTYLHAPEPEYPNAAREDEQEGLVVLRVLVSRQGRPVEIRIARTSGFRVLDAAAVAGVEHWVFSPAADDDGAVEAWMEVPIRFRLR